MSTNPIRTFIAIEIPDSVKQAVDSVEAQLMKSRADINWVKARNLHLTLKFLGDISPDRLPAVGTGVHEAIGTVPSFQITLGQLGGFPNLNRPRIFWIGISKGRQPLTDLQKRIESALCARAFVREERPFSPHLTIGRVRSHKGLNDVTARLNDIRFEAPSFQVRQVAIIKSDLQPTGPVYTVMEYADLKV